MSVFDWQFRFCLGICLLGSTVGLLSEYISYGSDLQLACSDFTAGKCLAIRAFTKEMKLFLLNKRKFDITVYMSLSMTHRGTTYGTQSLL